MTRITVTDAKPHSGQQPRRTLIDLQNVPMAVHGNGWKRIVTRKKTLALVIFSAALLVSGAFLSTFNFRRWKNRRTRVNYGHLSVLNDVRWIVILAHVFLDDAPSQKFSFANLTDAQRDPLRQIRPRSKETGYLVTLEELSMQTKGDRLALDGQIVAVCDTPYRQKPGPWFVPE